MTPTRYLTLSEIDVVAERLRGLGETMATGFAALNSRLDRLNGSVAMHEQRLGHVETNCEICPLKIHRRIDELEREHDEAVRINTLTTGVLLTKKQAWGLVGAGLSAVGAVSGLSAAALSRIAGG